MQYCITKRVKETVRSLIGSTYQPTEPTNQRQYCHYMSFYLNLIINGDFCALTENIILTRRKTKMNLILLVRKFGSNFSYKTTTTL